MLRSAIFALLVVGAQLATPTFSFAAFNAVAYRISGQYVEARTCDVWTGPCFANADFNLSGKNAVLAWKFEKGRVENAELEGLSVVAVLAAENTLGLTQYGPTKAVLIVDNAATEAQKKALVRFAREQGGELLRNVVAVRSGSIDMKICPCENNGCAEIDVPGMVRVKTRCLHKQHDKACGNETAFYPPLIANVRAIPAAAEEHTFRGEGLGHTYQDNDRRGAYVGSFEVR